MLGSGACSSPLLLAVLLVAAGTVVRAALGAPAPVNRVCARCRGGEWPRSICSGTLLAACRDTSRPTPPTPSSDPTAEAEANADDAEPSSEILLHTLDTPGVPSVGLGLCRAPSVGVLRLGGSKGPGNELRLGASGGLLKEDCRSTSRPLLANAEHELCTSSDAALCRGEAPLNVAATLLPAVSCLQTSADVRAESRLFVLPFAFDTCHVHRR